MLKGRQVDAADANRAESFVIDCRRGSLSELQSSDCLQHTTWCWCTDQVFRRFKGAPSEALRISASVWNGAKRSKISLKCEVSMFSYQEAQSWQQSDLNSYGQTFAAMLIQPSHMPEHWTNLTQEISTSWRHLEPWVMRYSLHGCYIALTLL